MGKNNPTHHEAIYNCLPLPKERLDAYVGALENPETKPVVKDACKDALVLHYTRVSSKLTSLDEGNVSGRAISFLNKESKFFCMNLGNEISLLGGSGEKLEITRTAFNVLVQHHYIDENKKESGFVVTDIFRQTYQTLQETF